ncbi:LysM domain protein [Kalmanozyma brasiliensis GHG001]|uniref:LysM domain protein n=1 Tax=Kalmanozyma brasiliensis (strain GHG001) TaxID=1365824 RepID=UPI001CE9FC31|nr:LysM domain protein [Kalmanozyma brasiliensis GHG001]KAF6767592.1 LysM domain protein [Kalmanozyma brasiliensis GHG001]
MRVFSLLLSAALLPLLARAAFHSNNTACTRHYTVQSGDTCDKIGQKTLTSTYQILAFNLLDAGADCYTLEIGTRLCLGRYGNDCQFVHQATDQDTCESIANAYGISTQLLQNNNPSLDCNIVYSGLMLCVSAGSIRPPADSSINSTDVRAAREHARQMWLQQQQQQQQQQQNIPQSKTPLPQPKAQAALPQQKHSSGSNKHASHAHHQHKHASHGGKSSHKQHHHKDASHSGNEQAPSHPAASHHQPRAVQDDAGSSEPLVTHHVFTHHQAEAQHDGATGTTPQRRHRSLSSRSQYRSHTP